MSALAFASGALASGVPEPVGSVEVRFSLSDGSSYAFRVEGLQERALLFDPENPTSLCSAPFVRHIIGNAPVGESGKVYAMLDLKFDEAELSHPVIRMFSQSASTAVVVDLRATSTSEELAKWQADILPVRDADTWVIKSAWDFVPAPGFSFSADGQRQPPKPPHWIDPETGEASALEIVAVEVVSDIVVPATYPDPDTLELKPCPSE